MRIPEKEKMRPSAYRETFSKKGRKPVLYFLKKYLCTFNVRLHSLFNGAIWLVRMEIKKLGLRVSSSHKFRAILLGFSSRVQPVIDTSKSARDLQVRRVITDGL